MTYREQLKDERWQRKRRKILDYADHRCQTCGAECVPLDVHHSYYRDGLMAWEYPDGSLVALCRDCHGRIIHGVSERPETEPQIKKLSVGEAVHSEWLRCELIEFLKEPKSLNVAAKKVQEVAVQNGFDVGLSRCKEVILALGKMGRLKRISASDGLNTIYLNAH